MYAIGTIIYGIPLNSNSYGEEIEKSEALQDALECQESGFLEYYHGGSDVTPQAFGIELDGFDECSHHFFLSDLQLEPTDAQRAEYEEKFMNLDPALQEEIRAIAEEPRVFVLWSTS